MAITVEATVKKGQLKLKEPVALAEGLDRQHSAVLLAVGLHLPRLIAQCGPQIDPPLFLRKLDSLARLALSAATQKQRDRGFVEAFGTALRWEEIDEDVGVNYVLGVSEDELDDFAGFKKYS